MDTRREFIKKASLLSGGAGLAYALPLSISKAILIDPAPGSTYLDAEHIVFLMQENRSFDHTYGTLQGVRGFNDPRAITLPDKNRVWLQSNREGDTYSPFRLDIRHTKATWMHSLPHSWADQVDARNQGKYDKWLDAKRSGNEEYNSMPLTLGYYTREDLPFYYSLADAFTICDQNFCSSLTGTTPNRLYFWTGRIRDQPNENSLANVWNEDADFDTPVNWTTFPEQLEKNGISWKIYQNELSVGVGFEGEEESWLSNFGDNPMEYFTQYHVKLHPEFIANLPKAAALLSEEIKKREQQLAILRAGAQIEKLKEEIDWFRKQLVINQKDQQVFTKEKYEQLSQYEKNLHNRAFSTNRNDPAYHQLTTLRYKEGSVQRELKIPKGDVLHQFREDVNNGNLPIVSWIAAPENFSDHPSSAWYGAWYISEVMDILTRNPDVWKKTIFILTYDENDGYFDHIPPFVAPHPHKPETGKTSREMNTGLEYVSNVSQQSIGESARISPIGLGYRVPMVIASPWSRGGWVCSQVFDHTSSLQFLEKFLSNKLGKKIEEPNISPWRRTICGDLGSAFRPYNGEKIKTPAFVEREKFMEAIHRSKFKNAPSNFKPLTKAEIAQINKRLQPSALMSAQEKGIRSSSALPYELYADGNLAAGEIKFEIDFKSGNDLFGPLAAGSPFQVYAPGIYLQENVRTWDYAVASGDVLKDSWPLSAFENNNYHLRVHGPNGFFREFAGNKNDPPVEINCRYERDKRNEKKLSGNISLEIRNTGNVSLVTEITDNAYKTGKHTHVLVPTRSKAKVIVVDTSKSYGWYDFSIRIKGKEIFKKRYAGRVETGAHAKTDPSMGGV